MKGIGKLAVAIVLFFCLMACGGDDSTDSGPTVVVNWSGTLSEGYQVSWPLAAGTYRLEMTSSNYGVAVQWVPNDGCTNYSEIKALGENCTLGISGQINIENPTTFGLGPSEIVTVKVIRL